MEKVGKENNIGKETSKKPVVWFVQVRDNRNIETVELNSDANEPNNQEQPPVASKNLEAGRNNKEQGLPHNSSEAADIPADLTYQNVAVESPN